MHSSASSHAHPRARFLVIALLVVVLTTLAAGNEWASASSPKDMASTWVPFWIAVCPQAGESGFECAVDLPKGSYVAGGSASKPGSNPSAAVIARYSSRGHLVWRRYWRPEAGSWSTFRWIGRDGDSNLYAAAPLGKRAALVKYSSRGKRIWSRNPVPSKAGLDMNAMAVDAAGNTYLAGFGRGKEAVTPDWVIIKVSPRGRVLWHATEKREGWGGGPADIAVDSSGVYVTGVLSSTTDGPLEVCSTIKYSSKGKRRWTADYYVPGTLQSGGEEIVVGSAGVTVLGSNEYQDAIPHGVFVLRYGRDGRPRWSASWPSPNGGFVWGDGLMATADGGAVVGVFYSGPDETNPGNSHVAVIVKYSSTGQVAWDSPVPIGAYDELAPRKVTSDGSVIAVGRSEEKYLAAARLTRTGELLSSDRWVLPEDAWFDTFWTGATGHSIYAAGTVYSSAPPSGAALVKLPLP